MRDSPASSCTTAPKANAILSLNAGSSSIKFALYDTARGSPRLLLGGEIEDIDSEPKFSAKSPDGHILIEQRWPPDNKPDFDELVSTLIGWIDQHLGDNALFAVGHRVVHGGPSHAKPALVSDDLFKTLEDLTRLAPLHEPHNIAPMRAIAALRPGLPQVACFDTAFHHTMPDVATRIALPREYAAQGVRRYGFHGLSYEFIAGRLHDVAPSLASKRVIVAHLGNGASLCAMRNGRSIDTTMSFTALDGLVMGTRTGSIDPGVILFLLQNDGMTADQLAELLYRKSGLLGVSGVSSDMQTLLASGAESAREAIDLFVFQIAREVGAMVSSLGGLDGFVFTAGIGEHAPEIRAAVCQRLAWLGIVIDPDANARHAMRISAAASAIDVLMIPTDEEAMIAQHTLEIVGKDVASRLPGAQR